LSAKYCIFPSAGIATKLKRSVFDLSTVTIFECVELPKTSKLATFIVPSAISSFVTPLFFTLKVPSPLSVTVSSSGVKAVGGADATSQ
jgi:hypothetical protein